MPHTLETLKKDGIAHCSFMFHVIAMIIKIIIIIIMMMAKHLVSVAN